MNGHVLPGSPFGPSETKQANQEPPRFVRQDRARGTWKMRNDKLYCSVCGAKALSRNFNKRERYDDYRQVKSKYCPFCGADMKHKGESACRTE